MSYARTELRRTIRAQLRDIQVLLQESRNGLILFIIVLVGGALLFHRFYAYPDTHRALGFFEALHVVFALIFLEVEVPFPEQGYLLQAAFFLIPILGLGAVADSVLRFGAALLNKQNRGQKWQVAMASTYHNHVIVCGLGKVGYRVIQELRKFNREVVVIEINPEGRFVEKTRQLGIVVIIADARRSTNLLKAGLERADVIIPCTDDELTNLDIALDARELNPHLKIVMRLFDPDLARRVERGFGIHTAFSTSNVAAPTFAAAAMRVNVQHSFYVGDILLNLSEITIEPYSHLIGWTIEKLQTELELSVVFYQHNEFVDLHPTLRLTLQEGVKILVIATVEQLQQINDLNHPVHTANR